MSNSSKPRVGANAISNLVGAILIVLVTIVCTPLYIRLVGDARYGILALIWLLFSYFGILDFGISRAMVNRLAKTKSASSVERAKVFWTALLFNLGLGLCGALVFFLISKQLMLYYIKVPNEFIGEIDRGLPWVALLIPMAITNVIFVGTLEAHERFFELNILQTIGSTISLVITVVAVALIAPRIDIAIIAGTTGRFIAMLLTAVTALQIMSFAHSLRIDWRVAGQLFRYGGWVAVAGIIAPLLTTIDQFVIGSTISAQAVAFYSVASNVASRANIIPNSLTRALFPRLSQYGTELARDLTSKSMALLGNTGAGLYSGAILLVSPVFQLWLGKEFGMQATPIAQILFVGMWFIGLAWVPFVMMQAQGRPDLPTKVNLIELLPYLATLWLLIRFLGLQGAAIAWALRTGVDVLLQFKAAGFRISELKQLSGGFLLVMAAVTLAQTVDLGVMLALGLAAVCFLISGVQLLLNPTMRSYAVGFLRMLKLVS